MCTSPTTPGRDRMRRLHSMGRNVLHLKFRRTCQYPASLTVANEKRKKKYSAPVHLSVVNRRSRRRILIFSMKRRAPSRILIELWPGPGPWPGACIGPQRCQRGRERWSINIKRLSTCRVVIVAAEGQGKHFREGDDWMLISEAWQVLSNPSIYLYVGREELA